MVDPIAEGPIARFKAKKAGDSPNPLVDLPPTPEGLQAGFEKVQESAKKAGKEQRNSTYGKPLSPLS